MSDDNRVPEMTLSPQRPPRVLWVAIGMAIGSQLTFLLAFAWAYWSDAVPAAWNVFALACVICVAGLMRRLDWSRSLAAITLLALVVFVFAHLMPISGRPGSHLFKEVFGFMPSNVTLWSVIIFLTIVLLAPLVVMGTHASLFRKAWW